MEDPWATGPSWASSSTPKAAPALELPPELTSPPRRTFDEDADPWAVPSTPAAPSAESKLETPPRSPSPPQMPSWGATGGDSGWGASPKAASSQVSPEDDRDSTLASPIKETNGREDSQPTWALDSPPASPKPSLATEVALPQTPDRPSPLASPPTPLPTFAPPSHKSPFGPALAETFGSPKRSSVGSPDFGAFGGFDDTSALPAPGAWGNPAGGSGGWGEDPWGAGPSSSAWGGPATQDADDEIRSPRTDKDDEEEGWAGVPSKTVVEPPKSGMEEEWEVAQARMRVLADRAPPERVDRLRSDWKELVGSVIGLHKLEGLTGEEEDRLEAAVRKIASESEEALRSLTAIPPDTNTYPPVLSSLETHKTYLAQLSRPNPTPSTSLFTPPTSRRSRHSDLSSDNAWTSRSRLGEPDVPKDAPVQEVPKSKWSFWGRKTPAPLVSSGGGALEVKPNSPAPVTPANAERPSTSSRSASIASGHPSRPASPAVEEGQPGSAAGPSGLGRFFGRLRKPSAPADADVDAKDMELTDDDFGFLAEVPSMPPPRGMGDLLSLDGGRSEAASLDTLTKPAALPAPLAPPPRPNSASSGGKFVARMVSNPAPRVSDMDLLGGLDFDGDAETPKTGDAGSALWEDFLVPSSTSPAARSSSPPSQPPPAPRQSLAAPLSSPLAAAPAGPSRPNNSSSMGSDFADFGTQSSFDDFGDFDTFSSGPMAIPNGEPPKVSVKPSSIKLDQSSAMSLVHDAVASKGKRWPAPPSPVAPALEPPPKAAPTTSFPFLSPPPPGRGVKPNDLLADASSSPQPPSASAFAGMGNVGLAPPMQAAGSGSSLAPSLLAPSSRSPTPGVPPPASAGMDKKQGLSAQDLSFFDSL